VRENTNRNYCEKETQNLKSFPTNNMIRSFASGRVVSSSLSLVGLPNKAMQSRSLESFAVTPLHCFRCLTKANTMKYHRLNLARRSMVSSSSSSDGKKGTDKTNAEGEEGASSEIVLTPGEKVVVGTRLIFWAGAFAFASVCAYYIGQ